MSAVLPADAFPLSDFVPALADASPVLDAKSGLFSAVTDAQLVADVRGCVVVFDTLDAGNVITTTLQIQDEKGNWLDHASGQVPADYKAIISPATGDWQPTLGSSVPKGAVTRWVVSGSKALTVSLVDR
jgi:hypothetical protein